MKFSATAAPTETPTPTSPLKVTEAATASMVAVIEEVFGARMVRLPMGCAPLPRTLLEA